ncbi:putative acetyl-CoA synthetase-like protein [Lyophyllum shimeji]|uniref:Acetyl-CoA synthetase-like protein n=1 Tax=Lyophyllum shimeji TaxID=47721 RepID=A0A9P3USX5_LYOSH|nr:putative acetyl-CoA synthetase-like protein [Lyophyllum shimeji]
MLQPGSSNKHVKHRHLRLMAFREIFSTLPELLLARSRTSTAELGFLDAEGCISQSLSYAQLFAESQEYARRLVSAGLKTDGTDIVITSFSDHERHIRTFWACCLAGIPVCPIPPLHPEQSRRTLFLEHLQELFNKPTLIADDDVVRMVMELVPAFKSLSTSRLSAVIPSHSAHPQVFPQKQPKSDDIVCFMLTSGSTGNSKGVGLRHSNLLSCVEGKIRHHETTSSSRFLNWIAFDHVACVSEVHLQALRADSSQYHVAPSAIIRNPRNLLDWCSRLKISYTFSPNFLLAQICRDVAATPYKADAIDLSSVRVFISGGESVPVKTAVEFTDILERLGAPRNVLRGGFGMTETGAGCIYDTRNIPRSTKDFGNVKYLSLGKCCDGTSVRVVDRDIGAVCEPMQEGQLQVKGPTIFREYHNNPRATAESFNDGWFITGDTALLDEDGNLYLMGRDKDCININGVKHPTVDVENYLEDLRIDRLMKSFVYVCPMRLPNADTETYGIFYQHQVVVEDPLSQADLRYIAATNRAIKNACTLFCSQAPHVVLPLPRKSFVKTALGKISRSSLAAAYLKGEYHAIQQSLVIPEDEAGEAEQAPTNVVERVLYEAVSSVFGLELSSLKRSQNLFDIGASSMHLMQLKQRLQEQLSIADIPTIEILQRPELGDLADYLVQVSSRALSNPPSEYNPVVCFNPSGSKPPLFLVHPGVGEVLVFINLARELADDRPVYALRARGFDADQTPFTSFEEMVGCYTSAIKKTYPDGPYYLAGYSFGGGVAFEIGKQLEHQGSRVAWVGVFNLPPHIQFRMKELVWVEVLINLCMFLALITTDDFEPLKAALFKEHPELADSDEEPLSSDKIIQWVFEHCDQERLSTLQLKLEDFRRWVGVAYKISCTGRSYEPTGFVPGALMTVFCAIPLPSMGTREEFKQERLALWKDFARDGFEMVDVDGEHYTMISEEHVASFAEKLRGALARAEQAFSGRSEPPSRHRPLRPKQNFEEVPIIDFSLAETDMEQYLRQLSFALEDVGFGVFINVPGFEDSFQKELFKLAEDLFSKPREWKESLGTNNSYALRGYFRADDIIGAHKAYAEAYRFGADMPAPEGRADEEVPFWLRLHEGPNQWPCEADLPTFREKMETLFERYHALNLTLNKHICQLLDIPFSALDDFFPAKTEFNSALWHYFPVTPELQKEAQNGFVQGMHEHRDPSTFVTCLIQSRAGLQAQNHEGKWVDIPMVEGGVVCNIGMQLMKLTGGRLVATLHRVNTLKIDQDRYTIPYVLSTKLDKPVLPLPQFANPELAKMHAPPNPRIQKLMAIEDPLVRSGFARLSLFPAVTKKLYPKEFAEGERMGVL